MADVVGDVAEVDAEPDHRRLVADGVDAGDRAGDGRRRSRTSPSIQLGARVEVVGPLAVRGARAAASSTRTSWPRVEQRVDDVRADEAGAAGDEDHRVPCQATVSPGDARRRPARPRRARGAAVGARADARGLRRRSSSTTARPTAPATLAARARRARRARAAARVRRRLLRRAAPPRARRSSASWTATRRSTRASCRSSPSRCAAGDADLVLGARRRAAGGAWPLHARAANRVLAFELRRRTGARADATSGRCAPRAARRCSTSGIARPPLRLAAGDGAARRRGRLADRRGAGRLPARARAARR